MVIIKKSLDPALDESQRILAGPLITDLAIKVPPQINGADRKASGEIQPHLPSFLAIAVRQLATATNPEFIQSLIHVFATLIILHSPGEILGFCATVQVETADGPQSGVAVLLRVWTELFEVIQGYREIRLSVVALARVFEFGGEIEGIMVKGELVIEPGRIVTRSQRRKSTSPYNPVKVLSFVFLAWGWMIIGS